MKLNSILKMDKLATLDATAITQLWTGHCAFSGNPEAFAMCLPAGRARVIRQHTLRYPSFILPVQRLTGQEIFYIQSSSASASPEENFAFNVTPLEAFKRAGPAAPVSASVTFFLELAESKAVALLAGRFDSGQLNRSQVAGMLENIFSAWGDDGKLGAAEGASKGNNGLLIASDTLGSTSEVDNGMLERESEKESLHAWLKCFHDRPGDFSFPRFLEAVRRLESKNPSAIV